ncbi:MinD/ParA family protein [Synechococcus sp. Tobar12-5m-g]|nr:MinD/ParA family protein [Synechococcus sp. Tobar12-5m-g]MCP9873665.1 MinD/ParA family protein [Synechococcus sp. Cruz CV-v-12]
MPSPMIITTHSYRGGTGKSNATANLATCFAGSGLRVGVIDIDLPSPGIHILFGEDEPARTINQVLFHRIPTKEAFLDVTPSELADKGKIFLMPGSPKPSDIAQVVKQGYAMEEMVDIFREFTKACALDLLLVDTHPGLNEPSLFSITVSDLVLMVLRPDRQDYQGTAVTLDVARKLGVPQIRLLVNKALVSLDWQALSATIEKTYGERCLGILPQADEMMRYGGNGLFCLQEPDHPLSKGLAAVAASILALRT